MVLDHVVPHFDAHFGVIPVKEHLDGCGAVGMGGGALILRHLGEEACGLSHHLVLDQAFKNHVINWRIREHAVEGHLVEEAERIVDVIVSAEQSDHDFVHHHIGHQTAADHDFPERHGVGRIVQFDENIKSVAKEFHTWEAVLALHDLEELDGLFGLGAADERVEEGVVGRHVLGVPSDADDHLSKGMLGLGGVPFFLPSFKQDGKGVSVGRDLGLDPVEELEGLGGLAVLTAHGAEEGVDGDDVLGDAVAVHDIECHDGLLDLADDAVTAEDGGEGGRGEDALLLHGADGVPHGFKQAVLAEEVDHEVPGVGAGLGGDARPAEELNGGGRGAVGELEDLLHVFGQGRDSAAGESGFEIGDGDPGEDLAEDLDPRRQAMGVEMRWKGLGFLERGYGLDGVGGRGGGGVLDDDGFGRREERDVVGIGHHHSFRDIPLSIY